MYMKLSGRRLTASLPHDSLTPALTKAKTAYEASVPQTLANPPGIRPTTWPKVPPEPSNHRPNTVSRAGPLAKATGFARTKEIHIFSCCLLCTQWHYPANTRSCSRFCAMLVVVSDLRVGQGGHGDPPLHSLAKAQHSQTLAVSAKGM